MRADAATPNLKGRREEPVAAVVARLPLHMKYSVTLRLVSGVHFFLSPLFSSPFLSYNLNTRTLVTGIERVFFLHSHPCSHLLFEKWKHCHPFSDGNVTYPATSQTNSF